MPGAQPGRQGAGDDRRELHHVRFRGHGGLFVGRDGGGNLVPGPCTADSALCREWCWFWESTIARALGELVNHYRIAPEGGTVPFVLEDCRAYFPTPARAPLAEAEDAVRPT